MKGHRTIGLFVITMILFTSLMQTDFASGQETWQHNRYGAIESGAIKKIGNGGMTEQAAQWATTYGGSETDAIDYVQQTSDGGYVAIGKTHSFGAGGESAWIFKIASDGMVVWERRFAVTSRIFSAVENGTGFVFVGRSDVAGGAWIVQLNAVGNIVWQKSYGGGELRSIQRTGNGFIVAGERSSDFWVLRLGNDGSIIWQNTYGGNNNEYTGTNAAIQQTADGGFIVAGHTHSFGAGSSDFWVLKLTSSGAVVWQKAYGGPGEDQAEAVRQTSDGGYIVTGHTASFGAGSWDAWVLKLDANGNVMWEKTYGGTGTDTALSIQETSDGGFVVAGNNGSFGAGDWDAWVLKLTVSGAVTWEHTFGGVNEEEAIHIEETSDGGFVVAARTLSYGAGNHDAWVLKLNNLGQIDGCAAMGSGNASVLPSNAQITNTSASPQSLSDTPLPTNDIALNTTIISETTCSAGGCALGLVANYNGGQMSLTYDLYTGPEVVTWVNSVNVMGNWFRLWASSLPADTPYQNTISFPFPNFGNVAVFTELVTPQDGIICADYALVNTGAAAANGGVPRIQTVSPELLQLPADK